MTQKTIILANPRGFCAGVDRAISIVERALEEFGAPIYVRHEVVHNKFVVDNLRAKGAVFVDDLADVPKGATLIYSAHGVSKAVQEEAAQRGFRVFDATCPLVTKVHKEVARLDTQDYEIIMIGHKGHVEVEGTMGQLPPGKMFLVETVDDVAGLNVKNPDKLAYVSQTTLSVDETKDIIAALNQRFPNIRNPHKEDICYATTNRQTAVKELAEECDLVIVVGSPNSSNSNRLREVAALRGVDAYMVDNASYLKKNGLKTKPRSVLLPAHPLPKSWFEKSYKPFKIGDMKPYVKVTVQKKALYLSCPKSCVVRVKTSKFSIKGKFVICFI